MFKTCTKCKQEKEVSCFYKRARSVDGLCPKCKICQSNDKKNDPREKDRQLQWNKKNREYNKDRVKKYYAENKETIRHKNKDKDRLAKASLRSKIYYYKNRASILIKKQEKRANNPIELEYARKSRNKNKVKTRQTHVYKMKSDPLYKLARNLRSRLRCYLGVKSKSVSAVRDLGCTVEFFKKHLESKFQPGMSWDNYGHNGWHIDHVVPLSFAKTESELFELCHYTNLQPLWAAENIRKSDKLPEDLRQ